MRLGLGLGLKVLNLWFLCEPGGCSIRIRRRNTGSRRCGGIRQHGICGLAGTFAKIHGVDGGISEEDTAKRRELVYEFAFFCFFSKEKE